MESDDLILEVLFLFLSGVCNTFFVTTLYVRSYLIKNTRIDTKSVSVKIRDLSEDMEHPSFFLMERVVNGT